MKRKSIPTVPAGRGKDIYHLYFEVIANITTGEARTIRQVGEFMPFAKLASRLYAFSCFYKSMPHNLRVTQPDGLPMLASDIERIVRKKSRLVSRARTRLFLMLGTKGRDHFIRARTVRTFNEFKQYASDQEQLAMVGFTMRRRRSKLPNTRDSDVQRHHTINWKANRKTQYKPV